MVWLLVTLGLIWGLSGEPENLTEHKLIVGKVSAGETLKFKLTLPKSQRTSVTLMPLDGDADLFVLLPPTTSISQTPFKSKNVALQVERVILPAQPKEAEAVACVVGATETRFVLLVCRTKHKFIVEPSKTVLADIEWQEVSFSENTILGALTVANKTPTWFEVTVKPVGIDVSKVGLPISFVLGPRGKRYLGWVALTPDSQVIVTFQRTPKADAFLVADCVSRLVAGVGISPEIDIAIDDLMPNLKPLLAVAQPLREGDWKRAGAMLIATLRRSPQTLTALHNFLQRTGIRLPRDVFGSRIVSGFGAISAVISAMSAINLPKQERVVLTVR